MTTVSIVVMLFGFAIVLVVALFVAAPLFGAPEPAIAEGTPSERDRWERQKRQALDALAALERGGRRG